MSKSGLRFLAVLGGFVFVFAALAGLAVATPLDDYVAARDDTYEFGPEPVFTVTEADYTAKIWPMKSQTWLTASEIDRPVWEHYLTIVEPKEVKYAQSLIFVGGGSNGGGSPRKIDEAMARIAVETKSIVSVVAQIPNQPFHFPDETSPRYAERGRSEDAYIAYTWDKFLLTGDAKWPARLPMTKAVVRAMDTVQKLHPSIKEFVVVGGSKRGWTTWTVGAVDKRVVAIIPAVIDVCNVEHSMQHHWDAYGYWANAIGNYSEMKIMERMHTPEFRALCEIVDPYVYRERYTMPKYIVASTGDQFFLPDSSQFYFSQLPGEKYLRYVPNTDHGLGLQAYIDLSAFYSTVLNNTPRPKFGWKKLADGSLRVTTETKPSAVRMWQAHNPEARNFRLDTIGKAWTSKELEGQGDGVYVAEAPKPDKGYTAFMVELEYPSGGTFPLKFTTEVSVVPQVMPFRKPGGWGKIGSVGEDTDKITVVEVGGDRYQMGYWYGKLLAAQISNAWSGFMDAVHVPDAMFDNAVGALWRRENFDTRAWELEMRGIADGCYDAGHPEVTFETMQRMLAAPDMSEYGCSLFAAWGSATKNGDLYQLRNLDWSMDTGLQDYPVIVVYNPDDGKRHAVVGFAGMIGAAVGGMNEDGIAVSEIQGYFGDDETLDGMPFPVLLRDMLYFDSTLDEALARLKKARRTNQYHYAIGDPDAADPKARLIFSSKTRVDLYTDDKNVTDHPVVEPTPFHEKLEDVLYWKNHNGSGNAVIHEALKARHGSIDAEKAIEVGRAAGVDGTLVSIVYHNTGNDMWVAFAEGPEPAHKQNYVHFMLGGAGN